jgi:hypothetical protein
MQESSMKPFAPVLSLALSFALFAALSFAPCSPAAAQPAGQGHGIVLPRPPHHHAVNSDTARLRFMRKHPCPATGQVTANCPGWRVEYIVPPARGGADRADNFKWERSDVTRPAD